MANKINARIIHKHDTEANWSKANNFIPAKGEIIIYDVDTSHNYERFKIGDGTTIVSSLPFYDEFIQDIIDAETTESANTALNSAKAYTDSEIDTWVGSNTVSTQIATAIENHVHNYAGSSSSGGAAKVSESDIGITTTGTGSAYTVVVPGITALTSGISFIMVPHVVSASTTPTLNVNNLGEKTIMRRSSALSTATQPGYTETWLAMGKPFRITYDGTNWIVENLTKPAAEDLYGTVTIPKGGTGAADAATARINLGAVSQADFDALEIGGTNLLVNTRDFSGEWRNSAYWTEDGTYNGCTVRTYTGTWNGIGNHIYLEPDVYTFSGWVKGASGASVSAFATHDNSATISPTGGVIGNVSEEFTRISFTFEVTAAGYVRPRFENSVDGGQLWVCGLKLEHGNRYTDWSPSPNDIVSIEHGGTGATTAVNALTNLGIVVSATEPENPTEGMIWFKIEA